MKILQAHTIKKLVVLGLIVGLCAGVVRNSFLRSIAMDIVLMKVESQEVDDAIVSRLLAASSITEKGFYQITVIQNALFFGFGAFIFLLLKREKTRPFAKKVLLYGVSAGAASAVTYGSVLTFFSKSFDAVFAVFFFAVYFHLISKDKSMLDENALTDGELK